MSYITFLRSRFNETEQTLDILGRVETTDLLRELTVEFDALAVRAKKHPDGKIRILLIATGEEELSTVQDFVKEIKQTYHPEVVEIRVNTDDNETATIIISDGKSVIYSAMGRKVPWRIEEKVEQMKKAFTWEWKKYASDTEEKPDDGVIDFDTEAQPGDDAEEIDFGNNDDDSNVVDPLTEDYEEDDEEDIDDDDDYELPPDMEVTDDEGEPMEEE